MNDITIREMNPSETPTLVRWLYEHRDTNLVDLEPFRRNQVRVYVAEDSTGILCFIPIQMYYSFDALAPRPDLAAFRMSKVCEKMTEHLKAQAQKENISTVILQPSDAKFSKFLQDELGYDLVTRETLQMKFDDIKKVQGLPQCEVA